MRVADVVTRGGRGAPVAPLVEDEDDDVPHDGHHLRRRPSPDPAGVLARASRPARRAGRSRSPSGRGSAPAVPSHRRVCAASSRSRAPPRSRPSRQSCVPASGGRLAHPGQSDPRYSAIDDVTSIERFSIRPCPLSISQCPVDFGLAPRGLEGGKAGLRLGKGGRDVLAECRLVLLHRQDVIASPFDHLRTNSRDA